MTAAVYYWLPKQLDEEQRSMGKTHFWVLLSGLISLSFRSILSAWPACSLDTRLRAAVRDFNMMSSIGAFIYGASQLLSITVATIVAAPVSEEKVDKFM